MSNIKFTVEDSKVSEVLKTLLNSGITVKDVEIINTQHLETTKVSKSSVIEDSGSSFTLYSHNYSIGQNEGTSTVTVISDVRFVGGTIFCIDETADGKYEFLDVNGNVIENIRVGDRPYYYRIIEKGSKDKYYVYYDEVYNNLTWTYCKEGVYVYESLGTSKNIRSGRTNTEIAMSKDNGAYVTINSNRCPTIWYQLQQVRNDRVGGCNDWFIPSSYEIELLGKAIKYKGVSEGTIAGSSYEESVFSKKWFWSSSEYDSQRAWYWSDYYQYWFGYDKSKIKSVFFIRAF